MKISINQPAYLPWFGYYRRVSNVDLHIVLDHVQFEKNSLVNRNRIIGRNHQPSFLTVPVLTSKKFGDLAIKDLLIDNSKNWGDKHLRAIQNNFSKSTEFMRHYKFFESIYISRYKNLCDLTLDIDRYVLDFLKINTPTVRSSTLDIKETKSQLILEICNFFGAKTYLSGPYGRSYLDMELFKSHGIKVEFDDYQNFLANCPEKNNYQYSIIEYLFNQKGE